jgi:hypothetical protein
LASQVGVERRNRLSTIDTCPRPMDKCD